MGTARVKYHVLAPGIGPFLARLSPRSRCAAIRIPEAKANVIKAVSYLLEGTIVAQYVGQITSQIARHANKNIATPPSFNASSQVKGSIDRLNATMKEPTETLQKANEVIKSNQNPPLLATHHPFTNLDSSYRDALQSNRQLAHPPSCNIHEARLQNRLDVDACQILI